MNSFGPSASQQFPLIDARSLNANRSRFRRGTIKKLGMANSIYVPTGRWPVRGWILLDRNSYNKLNAYSTSFQLNIGDTTRSDNVKTMLNLSIVQAQCVTRGLSSDPNAIYLVELTDDEGILSNKWFQAPLNSAYNIRVPAYPQTFYPWSLNSGVPWTWSTMLQDMWNNMSTVSLLGTWPGLPFTPVGTPEGFWFHGVSAWSSFIEVVEYLGMTLACDLTKTNPYTLVVSGAADTTFTALQTKYATNLEDDLEWQDFGAGRVPGTVTVFFRRRNSVYGTEETVRYDPILQWESASSYSVSVSAPAFFTGAIGTHYIWCDFTVRYDQDGIPLPDDVTTANAIAQERVSQYYNKIYRGTSGFMTQTYAGALPFTNGSQVDGVCWYQDYRDNDIYGGWRTQIVRGDYPPWSGIWGDR